MKTRNQILFNLIIFALLDLIVPFPITAAILIYVLIKKPTWFKELVDELYGTTARTQPPNDRHDS